jgi:hypothetical protein
MLLSNCLEPIRCFGLYLLSDFFFALRTGFLVRSQRNGIVILEWHRLRSHRGTVRTLVVTLTLSILAVTSSTVDM